MRECALSNYKDLIILSYIQIWLMVFLLIYSLFTGQTPPDTIYTGDGMVIVIPQATNEEEGNR